MQKTNGSVSMVSMYAKDDNPNESHGMQPSYFLNKCDAERAARLENVCKGCVDQNITIIKLKNQIVLLEKTKSQIKEKLGNERKILARLHKENEQLKQADNSFFIVR